MVANTESDPRGTTESRKANCLDDQEIKEISTLAAKWGCPSAWEPSCRQEAADEVTECSVDAVMLVTGSTADIAASRTVQ
jgi:hypothetical protein